jgi:hypothetical protein
MEGLGDIPEEVDKVFQCMRTMIANIAIGETELLAIAETTQHS